MILTTEGLGHRGLATMSRPIQAPPREAPGHYFERQRAASLLKSAGAVLPAPIARWPAPLQRATATSDFPDRGLAIMAPRGKKRRSVTVTVESLTKRGRCHTF